MAKAKAKQKVKAPTPIEAFDALPAAEKERQAAEFDKEFVPTRPLTGAQRALWRKARRKIGRPKVGEGAKVVSLSIEGELLRRTDALAKKRKLTRSELVVEALRAALAKAG
jgi:hypothetical protein